MNKSLLVDSLDTNYLIISFSFWEPSSKVKHTTSNPALLDDYDK